MHCDRSAGHAGFRYWPRCRSRGRRHQPRPRPWLAMGVAWADVYDPETGTWANTGSLHVPRYGHSAFLLTSGMHAGKVMVSAGGTNGAILGTTELYDPGTGTWSA